VKYRKFSRSGEHKGDIATMEGINEWVFKFASQKNQVIMYAIFALDV
jgi:hypothetical protein